MMRPLHDHQLGLARTANLRRLRKWLQRRSLAERLPVPELDLLHRLRDTLSWKR